ncbi:hypothetical protein [Haloechinothrix aidingensis]|uniref:hypothetical protein n=1 Tax=Haloechinothrix aidingensis TaxID=2752311 RepID=UPI001FE5CC4F|nr:hypothetical protein [Haloechinothrix aidingensis]
MSASHNTPERTRWAAVVALALIIFMAGLDMTIAAIALPAIGDEFGVPAGSTQWVQLSYLLPSPPSWTRGTAAGPSACSPHSARSARWRAPPWAAR